jgi:hypothetical protein
MASQQQVDGLLGTIFTSLVTISGYNFPLFQKMNAQGHFIILLDGLDEMRHAMSWDDFKYNFGELSKLIYPATKAILFGRPNTFRNKEEYEHIIEGIKFVSSPNLRTAGSLSFEHVEIEPFTSHEIYAYLESYLSYLLKRGGAVIDAQAVRDRVSEVKSLRLDELIARPVHAQMIAQIASDFRARLPAFTRSQLYDKFIDFVLRCDFERSGGTGLAPEERRLILRRLAWYVWFEIGANSFQTSEIKMGNVIFGHASRPDAREREVLSGALIEAKPGEHFYFAHRSFQEFLIAEAIIKGERRISRMNDVGEITDEIIEFIADAEDSALILRVFEDLAIDVRDFSTHILKIAFTIYKKLLFRAAIKGRFSELALENYCLGVRLLELFRKSHNFSEIKKLLTEIRRAMRSVSDERDYILAVRLSFLLFNSVRDKMTKEWITKSIIRTTLAALPLEDYVKQIEKTHSNVIAIDKGHAAARVLRTAMTLQKSGTQKVISIDLDKTGNVINLAVLSTAREGIHSFALDQFGRDETREVILLHRIMQAASGDVRIVEAVVPKSVGRL